MLQCEFFHIIRQGAPDLNIFFRHRMNELQRPGMQAQPFCPQREIFAENEFRFADQRMADGLKMKPDLILPACLGLHIQDRVFAEPFENLEMRHGVLAFNGLADHALVLRDPAMRERAAQDGATPVGNKPAEFGRFLRDEIAKWTPIIQQAGIKLD